MKGKKIKEKIEEYLQKIINKNSLLKYINGLLSNYTPEYIGNNFNLYFSSDKIDNKLINLSFKKTARQQRAYLDIKRGKFFEEALELLLNEVFMNDKNYSHIHAVHYKLLPKEYKEIVKNVNLKRKNCDIEKKPDVDLIVFSENYKDRIIFISVKGTARERIGQFLSNIFIFDPSVIKAKYNNDFYCISSNVKYKMIFVCFDMAKQKDFSLGENMKNKKKTQKQMEVYLIDDDPNIGYGVYVLNNLPKLHKVGSFSELIAKIKTFFNN